MVALAPMKKKENLHRMIKAVIVFVALIAYKTYLFNKAFLNKYSKNPHVRTLGLRTLRLKVGQKDTIYIRTHSA